MNLPGSNILKCLFGHYCILPKNGVNATSEDRYTLNLLMLHLFLQYSFLQYFFYLLNKNLNVTE